jgi:uncharacterized low-complexity protein
MFRRILAVGALAAAPMIGLSVMPAAAQTVNAVCGVGAGSSGHCGQHQAPSNTRVTPAKCGESISWGC